ncbi:hypothetical protein LEMLEM_LOCUS25004 [Lemmus lemmus]
MPSLLPPATCTPKLSLVTAQAALEASTTRDENCLAAAALKAPNTFEQITSLVLDSLRSSAPPDTVINKSRGTIS